ncbi:hypothetical protein AMJ80_08905 [bacterium SM23_31]|nr:MAG: hypothetical protein AMJ80_08905 [bacterium SM23_31]
MFIVSEKQIVSKELIKAVENPEAGAIATFTGVVRNNDDGKTVLRMEYEAHKEMAEKLLAELGEEIKNKFPIIAIAMQHRVGMLEIGESSVMMAVSAAHRVDAFNACRYAIDKIKTTLPVWKKEYFENGSNWVKGTPVYT